MQYSHLLPMDESKGAFILLMFPSFIITRTQIEWNNNREAIAFRTNKIMPARSFHWIQIWSYALYFDCNLLFSSPSPHNNKIHTFAKPTYPNKLHFAENNQNRVHALHFFSSGGSHHAGPIRLKGRYISLALSNAERQYNTHTQTHKYSLVPLPSSGSPPLIPILADCCSQQLPIKGHE